MLDENAQYHLRGVRQMRKFRAEQDWSATVLGLFGSWMGTFLPVMFLTLPSKPHSALSRWEIAADFASVGVGSYSVLWCARKIVDWLVLRNRREEKENRPSQ
jgi:hypothetical protein